MPRKVTAYLCEHRCGRQASTVLKSVEAHEATCFLNPARRSCKTCEHEGEDGGGYPGEPMWRECNSPDGDDPLEEFNVAKKDENQIAVNCRYWQPSKWRYPDGVYVPQWQPQPPPDPDPVFDSEAF
jgi:hypothetical protein